ncbi:MAG: hypothetical protein ISS47_03990 [Candidatus Omnitrophica bacterium]|nr:hypothetical protein [Candidatus Omnitrophota bacterium]
MRFWPTWSSKKILVILAFLFFFFLLSFKVLNNDIWVNLATGKYIILNGEIPKIEVFSYGSERTTMILHTWLSDAILYIFYLLFSFNGIIVFKISIYFISFFILLKHVIKKRTPVVIAVALFILTTILISERFLAKAEMFGVFYFILFLITFDRFIYEKKRSYFMSLFLIQVLWTNQHASFILGPVIIFLYACACYFEGFCTRRKAVDYKTIVALFSAAFLSICINPYGLNIIRYPFVQADNCVFVQNIAEWLPSFIGNLNITEKIALIVIVLNIFCFIFNRRKINWFYFLLFITFLYVYFYARRFIVYFGIVSFLSLCYNVSAIDFFWLNRRGNTITRYVLLCIEVFLLLLIINGQEFCGYHSERKFGFGVTQGVFPTKTVSFIANNNNFVKGNIINNYDIGNYLIWHLYPKKKVFIDGRNMVYSANFYMEYRKMMSEPSQFWDGVTKEHNVSTALFSYAYPSETNLIIPYVHKHPEWGLVTFDTASVLYAHKGKCPNIETLSDEELTREIINFLHSEDDVDRLLNYAYLCMLIEQDSAAEEVLKYIVNRQPYNTHAYEFLVKLYEKENRLDSLYTIISQKIKYTKGNYEDYFYLARTADEKDNYMVAIKNYIKSIRLQPDFVPAYNNLGLIYLKTQKYHLAKKCFLRGYKKNSSFPDILFNLGLFYKEVEGNYEKATMYWHHYLRVASDTGFSDTESGRENIDIVNTGLESMRDETTVY